jgi:hypothetical protein
MAIQAFHEGWTRRTESSFLVNPERSPLEHSDLLIVVELPQRHLLRPTNISERGLISK